jgi:hypothetical protein
MLDNHRQVVKISKKKVKIETNSPSAWAKVAETDSLLGGQVNHDETIDTSLLAVTKHTLLTILEDRVEVTHEHQRGLETPAAGSADELKDGSKGDTILKGLCISSLNGWAISDGVCERNSKLDNIWDVRPNVSKDRPFEQRSLGLNYQRRILETKEDINSLLDGGISCSDVCHKGCTFRALHFAKVCLIASMMKSNAKVAGQKSVGIRRKGKGRVQWGANNPYIYVQDEIIARE